MAKTIKDLKALENGTTRVSIDIKDLKDLKRKARRFFRSAGVLGCHTRIRAGFPRERWIPRTMARDRPSPYGEVPFFP